MTRHTVNRRRFIQVSTTTVASLLVGCPDKDVVRDTGILDTQPIQEDAMTDAMEGRDARTPLTLHDVQVRPELTDLGGTESHHDASAPAETDTCILTSSDITGPYWRPSIPVRHDFDIYGHPGERLTLSGRVLAENCQPIPNAVMEMWHAYPIDKSANELSAADSVEYDTRSADYRYYGQFATNEGGEYTLSTKKPGWYLNGQNFRPSHIHVRIYVNNTERLTTQLYFADDPYISSDPWASEAPDRILVLASSSTGVLMGQFDFTLTNLG